jgi:hypothetical protein
MKLNKEEQSRRKSEVGITSQPSSALRAPSPAPASEGNIRKLEWWESLTAGERKLICCVMRMLRGAKRSHSRDVAGAATKWERGIGCFIKVRLMSACRAGQLSKSLNPTRRQVCLRCCPPHPACDRWVRAGLATDLVKAETLKPEMLK